MLFAKRKRVIVAIIALVGFVCVFSACFNNQMPQKLSQMPQKLSELEETILLQRLTDHGISIPANLEISVICNAIADLEVDSDRSAPVVGWTEFADFYEELRSFVKEHSAITQYCPPSKTPT